MTRENDLLKTMEVVKRNKDLIFLEQLTLSDGSIAPNSLKTLNGRFGGYLNGSEPKLKRHC